MKALQRRLDRLENARQPLIDAWGQTLLERLERGLQRVRDAGLVSSPPPQWVVDRMRSISGRRAARR